MTTETRSTKSVAKAPVPASAGLTTGRTASPAALTVAAAGNLALQRVAAPRLQRKSQLSRRNDVYEEEADRASQHVLTLISAPTVQRKCACGGEGECDECRRKATAQSEIIRRRTDDLAVQRFSLFDDAPSPAGSASTDTPATADNPPATGNSPAAPAASPGLIVEDNVTDLGAGQMKKSEFLGQLRSPVNDAAQSALQGTVWASLGSVAIDPWFRQYSSQSAGQLERTIQQSVPGSAGVTSAGAYIPLVSARVQSAVGEWARTGKVPPGVPAGLPGMGAGVLNTVSSLAQSGADALSNVANALGGAVSDVAQGVSDVASSLGSGISSAAQTIGNTISDIGGMLFKAKDGGARAADDPRAFQSRLGNGESLDGSLQSRMSSAFGYDFSSVRVHKDNRAAQLSSDLNARAFTIGNNVAFGAGEYQPGNPIGDALIAHELAHVVQQGGATAQAPLQKGESETGALEEDADASAVRAVTSIWGGDRKELAHLGKSAIPRLMSGLRLQRCSGRERKLDTSGWTAKRRQEFINKNFPDKDRSLAAKILQDMQDSGELKFYDEASLKAEVAKRLDTVQLLRKAQEPYGAAFDYPENAPQCFPKGARKQGQINKAARAYWGPVQFNDDGYYFDLTDLGKKNAYKALTTLFSPQSNMCDKTLIHCDYLASVIHFRAFADEIGPKEFDQRVMNGDIEMKLAWNGFQNLEDVGWSHSKKSISIREVRPKNEKDLVIGDQVIFFNHRAYDLINAGVHHEWRLENAFLIDRKAGVDYFEGHGSGIKTNHTMLVKLAQKYNEIVSAAKKVTRRTASKDAKDAAAAKSEMDTTYPNIKPVNGKWNIVGESWSKDFNEELKPLDEASPEKHFDLPGLHDPDDPSKMNCIKRPSDAPGDSC